MATLTETWEPANHLEHQLREALRTGDQDAYFAALRVAELFIPLPKVEPGAPQPAFTWPTSTRDGRTHVLAYTSPEAARACLGPGYEHFARMPLTDVARSWPDAEWWLAVDSGLPIEGYLPAWFIGQLVAGAAQQPQQAPQQRAHERQEPAPGASTAPPPHDPASGQDAPLRFPPVAPPGDDTPPPVMPPAAPHQHGVAAPPPHGEMPPPLPDAPPAGHRAGDPPAPPGDGFAPPRHGEAPPPPGDGFPPPRPGEARHAPQHGRPAPPHQNEAPQPYGEMPAPPQQGHAAPPPPSHADAAPRGDVPPPGFPQGEAPPPGFPQGEAPPPGHPQGEGAPAGYPQGETPPPGYPQAETPPHGDGFAPPRHGEAPPPPRHGQVVPPPGGEAPPYGAPPFGEAQYGQAPPAPHGEAPSAPPADRPPAPHGEPLPPAQAEVAPAPHGEARPAPPVPHGEVPPPPPAPRGETFPAQETPPGARGESPTGTYAEPLPRPQGEAPPGPYGEASPGPYGEALPAPGPYGEAPPAPGPHGEASPGPYGEAPPAPAPGELVPPYGEPLPAGAQEAAPASGEPAPRPGLLDGAVPPVPALDGTPPVAETRPQPAVSDADPAPPGTPGATGTPGAPAAPVPAAPARDAAPYGAPPAEPVPAPPSDRPSPPYGAPPASRADVAARVGEAPISLHITDGAEFTPLDDEERALYEAAQRGDGVEFLRILLAVRQIWVPMVEGGDLMLGPGRPGFQWYTQEHEGHVTVPLFTGPSRMREAMGGHPFVLSDLAKVFRFWPDTSWDLVVNVGSPIGASIPGDRITALSLEVDAEAAARLAQDFPAQNDAERQLFDRRTDPDLMVKTLLETSVFLPVWSRNPPTVQTPPDDPAFPWSAVPVRGRMAVPVFTSFDWMKEAVGTTGFVMPTFADLLTAWPEPGWSVSVNAGTPIEVTLSGEQIRALAGSLAERPPGPLAPPTGIIAPPAEPAPIEDVPGGPDDASPAVQGTGAPPAGGAEAARIAAGASAAPDDAAQVTAEAVRPAEAPADEEAAGIWTIMQKVVPPAQVPWYLDKAYDRVAGFVHRVRDVIELGTPRQLYEGLGLLRDGSPFGPDDTEAHVIRWPAYRPSLYRVPFGGTEEEALKAWGEEGWVVEAPPFQGDGFAPGSGGTIPEYKVDSMRLPHGAEMYVIGSDGSERFLARYDADRLVWGDAS